MENDFFSHLSVRLAQLLTECLKDPSAGFFRKPVEVAVAGSEDPRSTDYALYPLGREVVQSDRSTFTAPDVDDSFIVLRTPALVRSSFLLWSSALASKQRLRAEDRLMSFAFERRFMDPILPPNLNDLPALVERLKGRPAELTVRSETLSGSAPIERFKEFRFSFDYLALYHSGAILRRDTRVKTRTIEYPNDPKEADRSAL